MSDRDFGHYIVAILFGFLILLVVGCVVYVAFPGEPVPITVSVMDKSIVGDVNGKSFFVETDIGTYRASWEAYSKMSIGNTYIVGIRNEIIVTVFQEV